MNSPEFGNALVGLSIVIQRRFVQICGDHDLTPAQGQLLCSVTDRPRRMAELAAALGMAKNALSQLVDRTERRGLVQRESPGRDRRVITLYATAEGKLIADALHADIAQRLPDIAADLDPADQQAFQRIATAIADTRLPHGQSC
ncbi:MarR family transcriptional regulator [Actinoplanes sp. TRM 88003]|uniref:MarR family transcriptional regulator n=1 Tax=Paractinoplanes aksuensis TaxID=2939490 RepID=A0ABT1DGY3_9ACTN|nr:MarR family transcriptional regulator [Actinoplanes aksuensis]MCO8270067.1 MarR family transcriptional regulator [Actinoplanes aksuensis]